MTPADALEKVAQAVRGTTVGFSVLDDVAASPADLLKLLDFAEARGVWVFIGSVGGGRHLDTGQQATQRLLVVLRAVLALGTPGRATSADGPASPAGAIVKSPARLTWEAQRDAERNEEKARKAARRCGVVVAPMPTEEPGEEPVEADADAAPPGPKRRQGGRAPVGYRMGPGRTLVPCPEELAMIEQARRMRPPHGFFTVDEVRAWMASQGFPLAKSTVSMILNGSQAKTWRSRGEL